MPYVVRAVKFARYNPPTHLCDSTRYKETERPRLVTFSNEWKLVEEAGDANALNHCVTWLVAAETCLCAGEWLMVTVFHVRIGEKITTDTPTTVFFPNVHFHWKTGVYGELPQFQGYERVHIKSASEWEPYDSPSYVRSAMVRAHSVVEPWRSNWSPTDMFFGLVVELGREEGRNTQMMFLNAVHPDDFYINDAGDIHIHDDSSLHRFRWKAFKERFDMVAPYIDSCYFDADGVLREGAAFTGEIDFSCVSDCRARRKAELRKTKAHQDYTHSLVSMCYGVVSHYNAAELASYFHTHSFLIFNVSGTLLSGYRDWVRKVYNTFRYMFAFYEVPGLQPIEGSIFIPGSVVPQGLEDKTNNVFSILDLMQQYVNYFNAQPFDSFDLWSGQKNYATQYAYQGPNLPQRRIDFLSTMGFLPNPKGYERYWQLWLDNYGAQVKAALNEYFNWFENAARFPALLALAERAIAVKDDARFIISNVRIDRDDSFKTSSDIYKLYGGFKRNGVDLLAKREERLQAFQNSKPFAWQQGFMCLWNPLTYDRSAMEMFVPNAPLRDVAVRTGISDPKPTVICGDKFELEIPLIQGGSFKAKVDAKRSWLDGVISKVYKKVHCEEDQDLLAGQPIGPGRMPHKPPPAPGAAPGGQHGGNGDW